MAVAAHSFAVPVSPPVWRFQPLHRNPLVAVRRNATPVEGHIVGHVKARHGHNGALMQGSDPRRHDAARPGEFADVEKCSLDSMSGGRRWRRDRLLPPLAGLGVGVELGAGVTTLGLSFSAAG
jgi:hypothetical protein